jgi:hypothetical protein
MTDAGPAIANLKTCELDRYPRQIPSLHTSYESKDGLQRDPTPQLYVTQFLENGEGLAEIRNG